MGLTRNVRRALLEQDSSALGRAEVARDTRDLDRLLVRLAPVLWVTIVARRGSWGRWWGRWWRGRAWRAWGRGGAGDRVRWLHQDAALALGASGGTGQLDVTLLTPGLEHSCVNMLNASKRIVR